MDELALNIRQKLIKSFISVGVMRLMSIPIGLGCSIILARALGPDQFGQYTFIMVLMALFSVPVDVGMKNLLTREVAAYKHAHNWCHYKGLLRSAHIWVILVSSVFLCIYYLLTYELKVIPTTDKLSLLPIAIIILPFIGLNAARNGVIKGLGLPAMSELPAILIQPSIVLIVLVIVLNSIGINAERAVWVQVFSAAFAFIIASVIFVRTRPSEPKYLRPEYDLKNWLFALTPFTLLALIGTLSAQLGIIALGLFGTDQQVGALRIAERGAQFVTLSLSIVNLVISPHIVKAYRSEDMHYLQRLSRLSARAAFAIALPIGLSFIFFGKLLLGFLYGQEYSALSYIPLVILVVGQLCNVFWGSVGFMLLMTGHERLSFKGQVIALVTNIVLCAMLIPPFGVIGAAISVSTSVIVWNMILGYLVYKKLGIRPSAL